MIRAESHAPPACRPPIVHSPGPCGPLPVGLPVGLFQLGPCCLLPLLPSGASAPSSRPPCWTTLAASTACAGLPRLMFMLPACPNGSHLRVLCLGPALPPLCSQGPPRPRRDAGSLSSWLIMHPSCRFTLFVAFLQWVQQFYLLFPMWHRALSKAATMSPAQGIGLDCGVWTEMWAGLYTLPVMSAPSLHAARAAERWLAGPHPAVCDACRCATAAWCL